MTGYSPLKKFFLSIFCAFLLLIYVPVACIVGNDLSEDVDYAQAETNAVQVYNENAEEQTTEELLYNYD